MAFIVPKISLVELIVDEKKRLRWIAEAHNAGSVTLEAWIERVCDEAWAVTSRGERGMNAEVTRTGVLDMQVCVPADWSDAEVENFANAQNPAGTTHGWKIRTNVEWLAGSPVRNPCAAGGGKVHVTLDC